MPTLPDRYCTVVGCREKVNQVARCATHRQKKDQERKLYNTKRWQDLRKMILFRDPVCRACKKAASTDVDHVISLASGGTNTTDNLTGLCHSCHSKKTVESDGGFGT